MKNKIIVVLALGFLASCATKPVQKTEPVVTETTGDVMVANGKNLYEGKCGKCHDLPKTNAYTAEKWVDILKWMQPKAKISDQERETIHFYLTRQL